MQRKGDYPIHAPGGRQSKMDGKGEREQGRKRTSSPTKSGKRGPAKDGPGAAKPQATPSRETTHDKLVKGIRNHDGPHNAQGSE